MIELYTWATPNGRKNLHHARGGRPALQTITVDITKGEQFKPDYLKINPNDKIPAIVDREGPGGKPIAVFESGAILIYLAEKTGKLLSDDPARASRRIEWLMFQMGGVGPMLGQAHHFRRYAPEKIPYAIERYSKEAARLYGVIDSRARRKAGISPATTRSPTSRLPVDVRATSGRASSSTTIRTSSAGSTRSPRARPFSAACRCRRSERRPMVQPLRRPI